MVQPAVNTSDNTERTLDSRIAAGFYVGDPPTLQAKIAAVHQAQLHPKRGEHPLRLELRTDFDQTLTVGGQDTPSTWEVMHYVLPLEGRKESQEERLEKLALQRRGILSDDDIAAWSTRELGRHVRYASRADDIAAISQRIRLRQGVKALFDFCAAHDIPRHIISAGAANPILHVMKDLPVTEENIIANMLHVDRTGIVTHWDDSNLVHPHNKREQLERLRQPIAGQRRCIIVFGDSLEDARMAKDNGQDIILRVRTAAEKDEDLTAHLAESWAKDDSEARPGFDLVLRNQDLHALRDLMDALLISAP